MLGCGSVSVLSCNWTRCKLRWFEKQHMIRQRHPDVAVQLVHQLEGHPDTPCLQAAADAARSLHGVLGFIPPSWEALSHGVRPEPLQPDEFEPGCQRGGCSTRQLPGWRFSSGTRTSPTGWTTCRRHWSVPREVSVLALSTCPLCRVTRLEPHLFRVRLLRRLRLPLTLSGRSCRCGLPLDSSGHHRAACARAGLLGRRGFALESVAARICREAGGRVTTNVMFRDLDLAAPNMFDARRLEVVVDGLPLFGGVQLAVDTTMVSALHNGEARRGAAHTDGVALKGSCSKAEGAYLP